MLQKFTTWQQPKILYRTYIYPFNLLLGHHVVDGLAQTHATSGSQPASGIIKIYMYSIRETIKTVTKIVILPMGKKQFWCMIRGDSSLAPAPARVIASQQQQLPGFYPWAATKLYSKTIC